MSGTGRATSAFDDPKYPGITYRRVAGGHPPPVLRGTGVRVQTLVVAARQWGWTPAQVVEEYGLSERRERRSSSTTSTGWRSMPSLSQGA